MKDKADLLRCDSLPLNIANSNVLPVLLDSPSANTSENLFEVPMNIALYARVSTTDKGQDPEMQLRELREYAARRGWTVAHEYVDTISGSKESRPQLNRMMADAHKRLFDAVVVWKFDRFARSTSHLLRGLETFRSLGIEFCSLRESVDTTTPAGKMMFTMIAAMAEFERDIIRVAWLGFTTTYKTAGTAKLRGSHIRRRPLWAGLWVGKSP